MKRKGYYLCSLLVMIFVFLSCRDEEQDCTQAMQDIQNQLKENDLLKSVSQEREQCVLLFESNKIIFPQELIQSVDVDAENWKTTLTFANGSTYALSMLSSREESRLSSLRHTYCTSSHNSIAARANTHSEESIAARGPLISVSSSVSTTAQLSSRGR